MYTADYTIRKYLTNKLSTKANLHFPSKATVDKKAMVYIGESSVNRILIPQNMPVIAAQVVPQEVQNLCEFSIDFVSVAEDFKNASDEIEKILDAICTKGFFDDLDNQLRMPIYKISIGDSLMTTQAEAQKTMYVHTQSITFSYGE
ncbi:hypothetical protein [Klebsiella quasipneumoniae]|uniref:hypothetical protein n=1 Tax=Klebsiella quasipneumoniae TaxID=1463165 RepID=UPI00207494BE|nr:hypothetical protein [Klebsiella quasipneumoniae]MCM6202757.1 hypothetical protein [Klebsiella pneumoniae]MDD9615600.1 hypothetical protein [Klebsiella quasipneumoniae]MDD9620337.1 hypothetical protein [Klebsiella quasipneumoniae]MDD9626365.1 hypothetical protein [Klebsiella quasipneumoniae]HBY7635903.1 hypothetical protein [Klebsiella pneumoniae]